MILSIMQPTFLPWIGYFDLIDRCDQFVYLDNVQFSKQSWQQRNRIRTAQGLQWLSLPVTGKGGLREVTIASSLRVDKFVQTIGQAYAKSPFFDDFFAPLSAELRKITPGMALADVNCALIEFLCKRLGITTPRSRASQLPQTHGRGERLVGLCQHYGADTYLSPEGARDYLQEEQDVFAKAGVIIEFQAYAHPTYRQCYQPFEAYASIIDLIFNKGDKSLVKLREGRSSIR